ncbi:hypothetical protein AVEN_33779-1, partial [Araneus ventricosus]
MMYRVIRGISRCFSSVASLKYWSVHDPDGVQVAVNEAGKVVGVCSTVKVSENLYFGGTFIVQEKSRDADIGRK